MIFQLEHIPIRPFGHQQALTQEHQTDESETGGLSSSPIKGEHSQWVRGKSEYKQQCVEMVWNLC